MNSLRDVLYRLLVAMACLWFLAGCSHKVDAVATTLPVPTEAEVSATGVSATATAVSTATDTPPTVIAPTETSSPLPTQTKTPTPEPTHTPTITPTTTPAGTNLTWLPEQNLIQTVNQMGGTVFSIAVMDDVAYVGVGPRLVTVNVADPTNPQTIAQSEVLPGLVKDIQIADGVAYLAVSGSGLWLFDATDPTQLHSLSMVPTIGGADTLSIANGLVATSNHVYNPLFYASDTHPVAPETLSLIDVHTPTNPTVVGTYPLGTSGWRLAMDETHVYVDRFSDYHPTNTDFMVIDVSDPTEPKLIATVPNSHSAEYPTLLSLANGRLLRPSSVDDGYSLLDITNPISPRELNRREIHTSLSQFEQASPLFLTDNQIIMARRGTYLTLQIMDITDIKAPSEIASLEPHLLPSNELDITFDDQYIYVVDGAGFFIVTRPNSGPILEKIGSWQGNRLAGIEVAGQNLFTLPHDRNSVTVYDLQNSALPELVAEYSYTSPYPQQMFANGEYLYLQDTFDNTTQRFNISNAIASSIAEWENVAPDDSVLTNSPPINLAPLGIEEGQGPIIVVPPYLYWLHFHQDPPTETNCCPFTQQLIIVDISQEENPQLVNTAVFNGGYMLDFEWINNHLYLTNKDVYVIDVTDPTQLTIARAFTAPHQITQLASYENILYALDEWGGLYLLQTP